MKHSAPLLVLLAACNALRVSSVSESEGSCTFRTEESHPPLDVLFVIDNSTAMAPFAADLPSRLAAIGRTFDEFATYHIPLWVHIGVVTADIGCSAGSDGRLHMAAGCGLTNAPFIDWNF